MEHHHEHEEQMGRRFVVALVITAAILVAEIVGGLLSNSLALLSDAAHVFLDAFALGLSYLAYRLARLPADERHTYGFDRAKVLAALLNSVTLFAVAVGIGREAYIRWNHPEPIKADLMLAVAGVGLVANLAVAFVLREHEEHDLNARSAFLHVLSDALASVGVIVAGVVIALTKLYFVDPLLSVLIAASILIGSWRIFRESIHILSEGTPPGVSARAVAEAIGEVEGVLNVHDLHVWSVGPSLNALSAHVVVDDQALGATQAIMDRIKESLLDKFKIYHTTIQFECVNCGQCGNAYEGGVCYLPQAVSRTHVETVEGEPT
jgi:cobalt-zinc-cadmium efflux system protein